MEEAIKYLMANRDRVTEMWIADLYPPTLYDEEEEISPAEK